jgi:hypothetical protein
MTEKIELRPDLTLYEKSMAVRLVAQLDRTGEHWLFTGKTLRRGYPSLWDNRRRNLSYVHVIMWELVNGPVPAGYDVHHECEVRLCCRPSHLKLMHAFLHNSMHHVREKCVHDHDYTEENTSYRVDSRHGGLQKVCRTCQRDAHARYRQNRRTAQAAAGGRGR